MAPMEKIDVQTDGEPGCALSSEARAFSADLGGGMAVKTPFSVSLSVPASPSGETKLGVHGPAAPLKKQACQYSLPSPTVRGGVEAPTGTTRERDRRFDHLRTFSGRLERQRSALRGLSRELPAADIERGSAKISEEDTDEDHDVPTADRYFAALEGAELETLRSTEEAVLPRDELWPFLLRFPITTFGMCLGVSSQAMLWKTLESEPSMAFLRVCPAANHVLWWVSVALTVVVSIVYLLKVVFYFEAVRREFHHPVRVNFFFAPWVACLFLVKGMPRPEWEIHQVFWYLLMTPILCLDLKIYGQWMAVFVWASVSTDSAVDLLCW